MQDRTPPDGVERPVREGQALGVGLEKGRVHFVRRRPASGLDEVAVGQVESGDPGPAAGENDGRHPVPATVVEDGPARDIAQLVERRPDPRFVVEIGAVAEPQGGQVGKPGGPFGGLGVVELLFGLDAIDDRHGGVRVGHTEDTQMGEMMEGEG